MNTIKDFSAQTIEGKTQQLSEYAGKVLLVVNVASKCGFTNQYAGLEELYQKYKEKGFEILAFPCNQFGGQEPGTDAEVKSFCERTYRVTFPMFSKVDVNGANAHPLFQWLRKECPGILGTEALKWNFTKFLISRNGQVVKRFAPSTEPAEIEESISALL